MIIECLVSSVNADGVPNLAPMGMVVESAIDWGQPVGAFFQLRPFEPSTTLDNLQAKRCGVLNFVDDSLLLVRSALNLSFAQPEWEKGKTIDGVAMVDACASCEFRVQSWERHGGRWFFNCEIVDATLRRIFPGYNRAQFAILEATILATRIDWIPREAIEKEWLRLQPLIEKTAGTNERTAWEELGNWLAEKWGADH